MPELFEGPLPFLWPDARARNRLGDVMAVTGEGRPKR
jgi:hypothetical protein